MEALLYSKTEKNGVVCHLCRHECRIAPGYRGICQVRENREGTLVSLVYGKLVAGHIDPIEKKPLYHVLPGSLSYSIATVGCNFSCRFCQNADIAQLPRERKGPIHGRNTAPEEIVDAALTSNCASISFTYTEPTVFFEYALDTAKLAHEKGLKTVFVSNGYMSERAVEMVAPFLDAANIDLKGFSEGFYHKYCGAKLDEVKKSLLCLKAAGIFLEITTLLIPGLNDDPEELTALASFIKDELGADTPWHISRFHPTYRLTDRPPTPVATLASARETGLAAGLRYVYTGNVPGDKGENTYCPGCGMVLVGRTGYMITAYHIKNGCCPDCGEKIHGVGI
jgi:pyruvate formate lyase activating enzyme